jgi:cation transport regulator ChaC
MVHVFGYGSLLFRPDFPHSGARVATVRGWMRRLDQGSPDHRGTPERLGRVATLVEDASALCIGAVFAVRDEDVTEVLATLDYRERGGYVRHEVDATVRESGETVRAVTWVARMENPYYLGPSPMDAMVAQIRDAVGPSGANVEYVLRLADTLRGWGIEDAHVFEIEAGLLGEMRQEEGK